MPVPNLLMDWSWRWIKAKNAITVCQRRKLLNVIHFFSTQCLTLDFHNILALKIKNYTNIKNHLVPTDLIELDAWDMNPDILIQKSEAIKTEITTKSECKWL